MKHSEIFFGALLVPIDFLALVLAGLTAYYVRLNPAIQQIRPAVFALELPLVEYLQLVSIVSAVIVAIFSWQGLYVMQATRRLYNEVSNIFAGVSFGVMLVIIYMFLRAELFQSRFILLAAYVLGIVFVTIGRFLIRRIQTAYLARGVGIHRVALVGRNDNSFQLAEIMKQRPRLGYRVVGSIPAVKWELLESIYKTRGIDEIIQTDPTLSEEDNLVLLDFCDKYKIDFKYIPNAFETHASHIRFRELGGMPVMELSRTPLEGWGRVAKRSLDVVGATLGLVFLSPLFAVTAIAIKLDSPGPVFYRQKRVGRSRQTFQIFKFRSMYIDQCTGDEYGGAKAKKLEEKLRAQTNERTGPLFKMRDDPRVTKVGRFIRRWRIDELPQLLNVLQGDMSLIGPRPHLPKEITQYEKHHQKLFNIKPGMSGMAQVNGNAGLSFEQEADLDIGYIEGWSMKLDVILLVKTFFLLISDRHAV